MDKKQSISNRDIRQGPKDTEIFLESIIDTVRESLLVLDKNLVIQTANKTFYQTFKVKPQDTLHKNIYDLGNKQWDIPLLRQLLEEILPKHNPFNNFKVEHVFPNIGKKEMLLNARQIKERGIWQDSILLAIEDITNVLQAERHIKDATREQAAALIRAEESEKISRRLAAIVESSDDGIVSKDLNGIINSWNKGAEKIFGYKAEEIIGKSIRILIPSGLQSQEDYILSRIKQGKRIDHFETVRLRKDGRQIDVSITVSPIKNSNGKIIGASKIARDITQEKLIQKQKDNFLGIASHELKTPVTSIKAYGQVLQTIFKRKGDTRAVELLSKMDAQISKLTNLIGDLLDVTKIQSGKLQFSEESFDFNNLVDEIIGDLQLTTDKHNIQTTLDKTCIVYGDKERTGQVITNLISNAIKYSPHSDKIIVKSTTKKDMVELSVQDFGIGIPEDKQGKLFQQFYRVSDANQNSFPGLGLGLYISSEIIKRQGGRIWVESVEGAGSTFRFSLPIAGK